MESDDSLSGEFQRSTRMPLDAVVRLHFQGTVAYQNGFAANVSATGMFVKHPAPPPLGTQLVFEFNLGSDRKPVQGAGEVVWVRDKYLGPGQPAGVGIRFLQLDSQSRDHIAEALFDYLEQSLTDDSLLDANGFPFGPETGPSSAGAAFEFGAPRVAADSRGAFDYPPATPLEPDSSDSPDSPGSSAGSRAASGAAPLEPYAEAFDFAALDRLPRSHGTSSDSTPAATAAAAPESRRPYSVFSPLDEADSQTADIVREALREDEPLPSLAAAASASSERGGSRVWILALLLLCVAGGGYYAWQQWGATWLAERAATATAPEAVVESAPTPTRMPEPLTAAPEPGTTLAEVVGVDAEAVSPAAAPPLSAPALTPPDDDAAAEDSAATREPLASAAPTFAADAALALAGGPRGAAGRGAAPAAPEPATLQDPADNQPRPPAPPAQAATAVPRAQRLTGIEWQESADAAGETVLVLKGDGVFPSGSFSYSEIGGENPRVLIKLKGMQSAYRGASPQGGGALVRGVRTGFHATASGNEIHVVVDLARKAVRVASLQPLDSGLTLVLAP